MKHARVRVCLRVNEHAEKYWVISIFMRRENKQYYMHAFNAEEWWSVEIQTSKFRN